MPANSTTSSDFERNLATAVANAREVDSAATGSLRPVSCAQFAWLASGLFLNDDLDVDKLRDKVLETRKMKVQRSHFRALINTVELNKRNYVRNHGCKPASGKEHSCNNSDQG